MTDNTWLSAIDFHDPDSGAWFYRALATDPTVVDGNRVWSFSIPVSDLKAEWTNQGLEGDLPNTVPLYAWDYGLNSSNAATAVINEIPMTSLSASPTEASLAPGQNVSVAVTHEPADATVTDVQWSSANQSVATVSDGIITGVAPGETDITVAASGDPSVSVTIHVTVADVAESTGITLSDDSLTLATSKSSTISALLAPGLRAKNPKVEWKSSEPSVVTVEPSDDTYSAALHATDRNGDATVTATVMDGEQHYQATAQIRVRQADFADFVIDSDGTLLGYVGGSTYISIPDGVTAIADDAFRTKTMQSVHVPASVTTIGNRVFMDAPNLREVTFEDTEDHPSQLTSVGEDLISGDLKIDTIELPRSVTHLGDRVFASSTIKKVVIPEGVTEIPAGAFDSAAQLSDLTIGNTVTSFGERAFSATSELSTIKLSGSGPSVGLPAALETIGDYALSGTNISVFEFPETVRTIGTAAFAGSPARTITLNSGLESIGSSAFSSTLVQNLDVPDSVTTVGTGAFADMGELRSIRLSSHIGAGQLIRGFSRDLQLRTIEMDADADNYSLRGGVVFDRAGTHLVAYPAGMIPADRSYTVPDGVEAIEAEAFLEVKLTSVTFPDSLRSIGESAFYGSSITSLALPDTFETLESKAFQDGALRSVDLGGTRVVGAYAFNLNTSLTDVNMRPDLGRLTEIQESAFAMDPIVSVSLPDSVVSLGDLAFANNDALRKVHIGKNLTSMDMGVFTGSNGLNELTVAEGNPVFSSDQNVLYAQRDDGLHLVLSLPTNTFTEYAVKPGTVQIDAQAFRNNTSLTKVTLPDGIKKLDVGSFNGDSSLAEINFPDSLESVDGFYNTAIRVADFGSNIVTIASDAFMFAMPQHLIVRGGNSGSFNDSMSFIDQPESAYFGEGMTSVTYDYGTLPKVLVLPASLAELSLSTWMMADTSDVEIYSAAEEGSTS
ncbi:MAG: leucine-rich repeat protein [Ancrocorticia sp.]|nr:leucine-rich repeat protein [Ancrocorticia sp.]